MPRREPLTLASSWLALAVGAACRLASPEPTTAPSEALASTEPAQPEDLDDPPATAEAPSDAPTDAPADAPTNAEAESVDPGPQSSDDVTPAGPIELTLYFTHDARVIDGNCQAVRGVARTVAAEPDVPTLATRLLLEGPTKKERSRRGVSSPFERDASIPEQRDLRHYFTRVVMDGDAAIVEFDDPMASEYFAREACRQEAIDAAFERTLRGLPGIARVRYRVAGRLVGDERGA